MNWTGRTAVLALAAALIFAAGVATGWKFYAPKPAPPITYAPEVRQGDGSLILERKPQADPKPAQQVPKGARVERVVQVTVQPHPPGPSGEVMGETSPSSLEVPAAPVAAMPSPVRVDLTLLRMPDQSRRVVASSPDGTVVGGIDIPLEDGRVVRVPKWAAGMVYGTTAWGDRATGAFLDRDLGPFRAGAEVTRNLYSEGRQAWEVRAKIGLRF